MSIERRASETHPLKGHRWVALGLLDAVGMRLDGGVTPRVVLPLFFLGGAGEEEVGEMVSLMLNSPRRLVLIDGIYRTFPILDRGEKNW